MRDDIDHANFPNSVVVRLSRGSDGKSMWYDVEVYHNLKRVAKKLRLNNRTQADRWYAKFKDRAAKGQYGR